MLPWSVEMVGQLHELEIDSPALQGNPLGDPDRRPLTVYTPPGYADEPDRRYPVAYVIMGFTGHAAMWRNRTPFRQPFPELVDVAMAHGEMAPLVVAYVDAWTSLGGSQYVDSPGTGDYHTYLVRDVVGAVDSRFRTIADRDHRAITGKSSGGYGAMVTALLRPDVFGLLATHAGDALFDVCYAPEFPHLARLLRDRYDGSYDAFWASFRSRVAMTQEGDGELVEMYAYAAAYSAEPDGTVALPFDTATGALVDEVWARWLAHDPVRMAAGPCTEAASSLRAVWIDAGSHDEYYLDLGATAFRDAVLAAGLAPDRVHFELFDAGHGGIEYRYPLALGWLAERMVG